MPELTKPPVTTFRITTYWKRKRNEAGLTQMGSKRLTIGQALNWICDELPATGEQAGLQHFWHTPGERGVGGPAPGHRWAAGPRADHHRLVQGARRDPAREAVMTGPVPISDPGPTTKATPEYLAQLGLAVPAPIRDVQPVPVARLANETRWLGLPFQVRRGRRWPR